MLRTIIAATLVSLCVSPLHAQQDQRAFEIPATDDGLPGDGPIRRYPWFQNLWKTRRSEWAKQVEQDQGSLVFLGDSITQGWGPKLRNAFPEAKVANRGISGDTTRGMLIRLQEDVLSLHPTGVVMLMGTNDLEEGAEPATIAANLKLILAELKKYNGEMPIVLCNVFPSSASKKRPADSIREINRLYALAVKGDPQITVIDTWKLFADDQGDAKKHEFPDLLHPNAVGYAKWAKALHPVLSTLGFVDKSDEAFTVEPGFESLFNGKDLTGWGYRPSTPQDIRSSASWRKNDKNAPPWPIVKAAANYDGRRATADGRYVAKNGKLIVMTPPEGRKIQQFWTQREFAKDFVLKLEFRATPNADSGVFLRGKQLQCRDYALAGPYDLERYEPQEWNELVVAVTGTSARCLCNGELLEAAFKIPKSGPIGLEGDRGQIEYRRIRIREGRVDEVSLSGSMLPRSTPEQQGISSDELLDLIEACDKIDAVHSLMVLRNGHVVTEAWWAPFTNGDPHQLYSVSKSFASTAVGLAISEGKLSLDDPVASFFPDELPAEPSGNLKSMKIRDLLTMTAGHNSDGLKQFDFKSDEELTKLFLSLPIEHSPGSKFLYNTPATYMCSAIVQRVTGQKIVDYLKPRLFEPLGISGATWSESPQGISHGGFGLNVKTEDIARFGQLYLQGGKWHGKQLIPSEWVSMASAKQTANGDNPDNDWNQGYGFQFWRCRHGCFRGDGAFGQFCIVIPHRNTVVAITSGTSDMGSVMQQVWDHLLPAIKPRVLPANSKKVKALRDRVAELALPVASGEATSPWGSKVSGKKFRIASNDHGIEACVLEFAKDKTKLLLTDASGTHEISSGIGTWHRQRVPSVGPLVNRLPNASDVAVAGSGAWSDESTFETKLWLFESPYRVDLKFHFDGGKVQMESAQNLGFGSKNTIKVTGTME